MKFSFKWPYKEDPNDIKNIKLDGKPVGHVTAIADTEDGVIVTGEFTEEFRQSAAYKKLFVDPDMSYYSLGPIPANPENYLQDYAKADVEMTMALYGVHPEMEEAWIHPGNWWKRLILLLAALGLWFVIYVVLHWLITGNGALFDWS